VIATAPRWARLARCVLSLVDMPREPGGHGPDLRHVVRDPGARPDPELARRHQKLLRLLVRELFQSEKSAELHCAREAYRLGDSVPATALRAVALHAIRVNRELPGIVRASGLPAGTGGSLIGRLFSAVRDRFADRLVDEERSYRGTLLGLRHDVDVVRMVQHVADACGKVELAGWCTHWLDEREPLVAEVERALTWFAQHPAVAIESTRHVRDVVRRPEHSTVERRPRPAAT